MLDILIRSKFRLQCEMGVYKLYTSYFNHGSIQKSIQHQINLAYWYTSVLENISCMFPWSFIPLPHSIAPYDMQNDSHGPWFPQFHKKNSPIYSLLTTGQETLRAYSESDPYGSPFSHLLEQVGELWNITIITDFDC
jgi:hypothetical protein